MNSISNARELGGYKTRDGKTVRKGVLLRTASLTEASQEELASLIEKYKMAAIIDLRASYELAEKPEPVVDKPIEEQIKEPSVNVSEYNTIKVSDTTSAGPISPNLA